MTFKMRVGSVSTAGDVAQAIRMNGAGPVNEIDTRPMDGLDIDAFDEDALYLICTSAYGGTMPEELGAAGCRCWQQQEAPPAMRQTTA